MSRQIHCHKCYKSLGEIRDAKLAKGMDYVCSSCKETENVFQSELKKIKAQRDFLDGFKKNHKNRNKAYE